MRANTLDQHVSLGDMPLWSWLLALLLLAMLFVLLSASGELLGSLPAQVQAAATYAHEFTHDGRHLLGIPCH